MAVKVIVKVKVIEEGSGIWTGLCDFFVCIEFPHFVGFCLGFDLAEFTCGDGTFALQEEVVATPIAPHLLRGATFGVIGDGDRACAYRAIDFHGALSSVYLLVILKCVCRRASKGYMLFVWVCLCCVGVVWLTRFCTLFEVATQAGDTSEKCADVVAHFSENGRRFCAEHTNVA